MVVRVHGVHVAAVQFRAARHNTIIMKITVGTKNKGKIVAVKNALAKHINYHNADVIGCNVESGVKSQPIGLDEIILGAKNRARLAYESIDSDLGVGIESGIFTVPQTKSGYMDTAACAIYDGHGYHLGLSSCFEYPQVLIDKILHEGKETSDIALELGLADDVSFREDRGMIGILTNDVIRREEYSEQAVHNALIHLLNKDYY